MLLAKDLIMRMRDCPYCQREGYPLKHKKMEGAANRSPHDMSIPGKMGSPQTTAAGNRSILWKQ
jgi:hypothetical protein